MFVVVVVVAVVCSWLCVCGRVFVIVVVVEVRQGTLGPGARS